MKIIWLVIGMTAVTYIPRLMPFLVISDKPIPAYWRRFLTYLPYTALGALIIPGVFQSFSQKPVAAILGLLAAAFAAWFNGGMILSILVATVVTWIILCV